MNQLREIEHPILLILSLALLSTGLFVVSGVAAQGTGDDVTVTSSQPTVSPGEDTTVEFTVENVGSNDTGVILDSETPQNWTFVSQTNEKADYKFTNQSWLWQTINTSETRNSSLTLSVPSSLNKSKDEFNISASAKLENGSELDIPDQTTQVIPQAKVNTTDIDFGTVGVGDSPTKQVVVRNDASEALNISGISITGVDESEFTADESSITGTLDAGDSTTLDVTFNATSSSLSTANLSINTAGPDLPPADVSLEGTAVADNITSITADDASADGATATGSYTATLNAPVQANVTLGFAGGNLSTDDISAVSADSGTNISLTDSSLVNSNAVVNTTEQGELDISVTFDSGVSTADAFTASIDSSDTNIVADVTRSESFTVATGASASTLTSVTADNLSSTGASVTGNYTATLDASVSANVTLELTDDNLSPDAISDVTVINGTAKTTVNNSTLANGNAVVATSGQGELDVAVTVEDGVNADDTFTASIDSNDINISADDSSSESFSIDTTREEEELDLSANRTDILAGQPVEFTLTNESGNSVEGTVTIEESGTSDTTDENGIAVLRPTEIGSLTVEATKQKESATKFISDSVIIDSSIGSVQVTSDTPAAFGEVLEGDQATTDVTVENPNGVSVNISANINDNSGIFAVAAGSESQTIPAGSTQTVTTTYEPIDRGFNQGTLNIEIEGTTQQVDVPLNGTGVSPGLVIRDEPGQLQTKPNSTDTTTMTLENDGNKQLNISLSVADPFSITSGTDISVPSGDTETIDIAFNPTDSTPQDASTTINITPDSSTLDDRAIGLSGTVEQPSIAVLRDSINFSDITDPTIKQVTVINTGTTSIDDLSVTTTDTNFTTNQDTIDLATTGGDSEQRLSVRADLSTRGEANGQLQINGSTDAENASVDLTANRIGPSVTLDTAEPITIDAIEGARSSKYVPIKNRGSAPLIVNISNNPFNTSNGFSIIGGLNTLRIPAGETDEIPVRFSADDDTDQSTRLSIATNDEQATADDEDITIKANVSKAVAGADLSSPDTKRANFDAVGINTTASDTFTVSYTGTTEVNITDIDVTGATGVFDANATEADVQNGDNITLTDGDQTTIDVSYTPDAEKTQTATVTITGSVSGEDITASTSLVGSGRGAELGATQRRIRFGAVETEGNSTQPIELENLGPASTTLNVTAVDVTGPFDTSGSVKVEGGTQKDFDISFEPDTTDIGDFATTLTLQIDGPLQTTNRTVRLTGTGTGPEPTLRIDQLDINSITVNETIRRTVTLENTGGVPFTANISKSDEQTDGPVEVTKVRGRNQLVPGEERDVVLTIAPDDAADVGSLDETVTLATDQTNINDTLSVTGTVRTPSISVSPSNTLSFGDTPTNGATQETITVSNSGNATLQVAAPTINGSDAFSVVNDGQQLSVANGSDGEITVSFAPDNDETKSANITVEPLNDPDASSTTIQLTGDGIGTNVTLSRSSIGFGEISPGETPDKTVTLGNDGGTTLNITNVPDLINKTGFRVSGLSDGDTIAPGGQQQVTVEANKTSDTGALAGTLKIGTNDTTAPVSLGAQVTAPSLATSKIKTKFGTTRLRTTTLETIEIENVGNGPLKLNAANITGTNKNGFRVVGEPDNRTLEPSETGLYTVQFDPSDLTTPVENAQGTQTDRVAEANLIVTSPNQSVSQFEAELTGEAVTPAVELDRRTLTFPETLEIGDILHRDVTVTNNLTAASADVNITGASISGVDSQAYEVEAYDTDITETPVSLSPGESQRFNVTIAPKSIGAKFATLSIQTNDTRQPVKKVGLSSGFTSYSVEYGSVIVNYFDPTNGPEPAVDVDRGLQGRNASLTSAQSTANTSQNYKLDFRYDSTPDVPLLNATGNASAIQYIDATQNADNFKESTFEIEVSKATLAATNDTPGNVSIYHEISDGNYDELNTELLFETTNGYIYEVTTDSYSVFAVSVPDQRSSEPPKKKPPGGPDPPSSSGGGGGVAEVQPRTDPGIEAIITELEKTESTTQTTVIEDVTPDQPGTTVEPEGTSSVRQITFDDNQITGSVDITEYTELPAQVAKDITETVVTDLSLATDSETGDRTESGETEANVNLISVTDISPSSEEATGTAATVTLTASADEIENPSDTFVVHETTNGWERLETTVEDTSGGEITLEAETSSFSLFAIIEDEGQTQTQTDTEADGDQQSEETTDTEDEDGGPPTVLIVVGLLAVVAIGGAVYYLRGDEI